MAEAPDQGPARLSWCGFTLDLHRGELFGPDAHRVHLRRQSLDVLLVLARTPGLPVSRATLIGEVWGRAVVTDDSLVQCVLEIRRTLGPTAAQVIRTVHRRGYVFDLADAKNGAEASVGAPESAPAEISGARSPELPFVGRQAELAALLSMRAGDQRKGQIALISGEPGIGKSRLLFEANQLAQKSGAASLLVKCHEIEAGLANGVLCQIIERLISAAPASTLLELAPAHRAALLDLVPWHAAKLVDSPTSDAAPASQHPTRLRAATVALFARLSAKADWILALDDVQWLDAASALNLFAVAQAVPEHRLWIWATVRPDELPNWPAASQLLESLKSLDGTRLLSLTRLRPADVAVIAQQLGPEQEADSDRIDWLVRESRGNPFYLLELIRSASHQAAKRAAQQPTHNGVQVLPSTILDAVLGRAQKLAEPARRLLDAAAVAGTSALFEVICYAALVPRNLAIEALSTLLATGWLVEKTADERYAFSHDKLREAVYQALPAAKRTLLHGRLAHALLAAMSADRRQEHAVIAVHARLGGELELAFEQFELAGDRAQLEFELQSADTQYSQALALDCNSTAIDTPGKRVALLKKRGAVRSMLGASDGAESDLRRAIALATAPSADHDDIQHPNGKAGPDGELARLHLELGVMLQRQHRLDEAVEVFTQTLRLGESSDQPEIVASAHSWLGDIDWMYERNRSAHLHFQKVLNPSQPSSPALDGARTKALFGLGQCAIMDARPRSADQHLDQAISRAQAPAESFFKCAWHALKGWNHVGGHSLNEPEAARHHFEQCSALSQKLDLHWYAVPCEIGLGVVEAAQQDFDGAISRLESVLHLPADVQNDKWRLSAGVWLAACHLGAGQPAAALAAAQVAGETARTAGPFMFAAMLPALVLKAQVRLGQAGDCEDPKPLINHALHQEMGYVAIAALEARIEWLNARGKTRELMQCARWLHREALERGLPQAAQMAAHWLDLKPARRTG